MRARSKAQRIEDIRQRILRCLWFDQAFATPPKHTDGGVPLRVFTPGWWNLEDGPDFRNAALKLGPSRTVKGDIEVHLRASDWEKGGHDKDLSYNGVILVVCLWNDTGQRAVRTAGGAEVPQLTLEPHLSDEKLCELQAAAMRVT